ncbi:MAG: HAD family phosphatase [Candidatus Dadabacteria bacterium]|nr:MAG: HAD family phosphatase [Candidatus Dadabacteria bacterium]
MLKAIIFDFDGVIADTEPLHLKAFQLTLKENGIELSDEDYFENYLAYDDKTLFKELLKDRNYEHNEAQISDFMNRKSEHFENVLKGNILVLEGVPEFISEVSGKYPLAIGSGAIRSEIIDILESGGLREHFEIIVSADEVINCKPDPEVFIEALRRLNNLDSVSEKISPQECLVIEDSTSGIKAAHSAGMKCLAITNSYAAEKLSEAELIKQSLKGIYLEEIEDLF